MSLCHQQALLRVCSPPEKCYDIDLKNLNALQRYFLLTQQKSVGIMGEVHPEVLESFKLIYPASAFEIQLEAIIKNFI